MLCPNTIESSRFSGTDYEVSGDGGMQVLIAVDDGIFAEKIVDFVSRYTWPEQSKFLVLHVIMPFYREWSLPTDKARREASRIVAAAAELVRKAIPGADVEQRIEEGDVKSRILDTARLWTADVVVVGSHSRSKGEVGAYYLLGSVATAVVFYAPCSVIVVRRHSDEEN